MIIVGIDPGAKGAACRLDEIGTPVEIFKFDKRTDREIRKWLYEVYLTADKLVVCLEKIHGRPGDYPVAHGKLMANWGYLKGLTDAMWIQRIDAVPQTWQRTVSLGGSFINTNARKKASKAKAQEIFPGIHVTLETADCVLIAVHGRKVVDNGETK